MGRAAQGFHAVTRFEFSGFTKGLNDSRHAFKIQHASDVVGNGGHDFATAANREFGKKIIGENASGIRKRIAVEK